MSDFVRYYVPRDPTHPNRVLVVIGPLVTTSDRDAVVVYEYLCAVITPGVCSEFFAFTLIFPRAQAGAPVAMPLECEPTWIASHAQPA